MEIKTKYNIGDWVWFMHENTVHQGVIKKITVFIEKDGLNIVYTLIDQNNSLELQFGTPFLFLTKAELLKSL